MFQAATTSAIVDVELDARLQALAADVAVAGEKIELTSASRKRARQVLRAVVLTVAGILLAAPTGGLTLLLCIAGVTDMIDVLEEDSAAVKLQSRLRSDLERYNDLYERIAAERSRRTWQSQRA